jgi:hypothetical protein
MTAAVLFLAARILVVAVLSFGAGVAVGLLLAPVALPGLLHPLLHQGEGPEPQR